ncbi:hypothetical protein [Mycoplasma anserisalpingitidis]|uniref:Uncharacterized protein n=1 Tax=Mycoplasma anserisalpingitidis TaxID=519450 RepID=A0A5B8KAM5_9MOLU|nr:hypothetical protein [Mycoplasma anserisalpingitidis]QDY88614.1 hypothetical protein FOY43_03045 [Mycoplasma anserisalpingitidis]
MNQKNPIQSIISISNYLNERNVDFSLSGVLLEKKFFNMELQNLYPLKICMNWIDFISLLNDNKGELSLRRDVISDSILPFFKVGDDRIYIQLAVQSDREIVKKIKRSFVKQLFKTRFENKHFDNFYEIGHLVDEIYKKDGSIWILIDDEEPELKIIDNFNKRNIEYFEFEGNKIPYLKSILKK